MRGSVLEVRTSADGSVVIAPHGIVGLDKAVELRQVLVHTVRRVRPLRLILDLSDVPELDPINVGSPGTGSLGQLNVEQMQLHKISNVNHVPYRGGAPLLTDFFGNHIPVAATPILPILQQAEAGAIVPLAVTSTERIPALKNVPTFAEIGYPEMNGAIWFWLAGPKGLPAPIVVKLNDEIRRLVASPETKQMFEKSALLSLDADSPALTQYIAGEVKRWTAFVEEKGLKK